jgi:hypothetical protein
MRWRNPSGSVRLGGLCENFETVELSSAQLLDLVANPVTVIPPPGPGLMVVATHLQASYRFGGNAYVIPSNNPTLIFDGPSGTVVGLLPCDPTGVADNAAAAPTPAATALDLTEYENRAVVLTIDQDMTGGDGTVVVSVIYAVCPV